MRESKREESTESQMAIGAHTFLKAELFWSFFAAVALLTHTHALGSHWTAAVGSSASASVSVLACKNITHTKIYTHINGEKKRTTRRPPSDGAMER